MVRNCAVVLATTRTREPLRRAAQNNVNGTMLRVIDDDDLKMELVRCASRCTPHTAHCTLHTRVTAAANA